MISFWAGEWDVNQSKTHTYHNHLTSLSSLCAEELTGPCLNGKEIRAEVCGQILNVPLLFQWAKCEEI